MTSWSLKTLGELVIPLDLPRTAGMCIGPARVGNDEQPNTAEAKWLKPENQLRLLPWEAGRTAKRTKARDSLEAGGAWSVMVELVPELPPSFEEHLVFEFPDVGRRALDDIGETDSVVR